MKSVSILNFCTMLLAALITSTSVHAATSIEGHVYNDKWPVRVNADDEELEGVIVNLWLGTSIVATDTSDEDGRFIFPQITQTGEYTVKVDGSYEAENNRFKFSNTAIDGDFTLTVGAIPVTISSGNEPPFERNIFFARMGSIDGRFWLCSDSLLQIDCSSLEDISKDVIESGDFKVLLFPVKSDTTFYGEFPDSLKFEFVLQPSVEDNYVWTFGACYSDDPNDPGTPDSLNYIPDGNYILKFSEHDKTSDNYRYYAACPFDKKYVLMDLQGDVSGKDFHLQNRSSVTGQVRKELNNDCAVDILSETGLGKIAVQLLATNRDDADTLYAETDLNGFFEFDYVMPGKYQLSIDSSSLDTMQLKCDPTNTADFIDNFPPNGDLFPGTELNIADWGFAPKPGVVSVSTFQDYNGNCERDENELPFVLNVRLHGELFDSTLTTHPQSGSGVFSNIPVGSYSLTVYSDSDTLSYFKSSCIKSEPQNIDPDSFKISALKSIDFYFAYEPKPNRIIGTVWKDADGDSLYDPETESGMEGIKILIAVKEGDVIDSTVTDTLGDYSFDDLDVGRYVVEMSAESIPAHYSITHPGRTQQEVILSPGMQADSIDWGLHPAPGKISGQLWWRNDLGDCQRQDDDAVFADIKMNLLDAQGELLATDTTNASGTYSFKFVPQTDDSCFLSVEDSQLLTAYELKCGNNPAIIDSISAGAEIILDFGYDDVRGNIAGRIWDDQNGNCIIDEGESSFSDSVQIRFYYENGFIDSVWTSSEFGRYSSPPLVAGFYTVVVDTSSLPGNYQPACDWGVERRVEIIRDASLDDVDFGFKPKPSTIEGHVWKVLDDDCMWTIGEPGFANIKIHLSGPVVLETATNSEGHFRFDSLLPGGYILTLDSADTSRYVLRCGENPKEAILTAGQRQEINFGYEPKGAYIGGLVWNDVDSSCTQEPFEQGLDSISVSLIDAQAERLISTVFTNQGVFEFYNVMPDSYFVVINDSSLIKQKYQHTCPRSNRVLVTVGPNERRTNIQFGYKRIKGIIEGYVWFDDDKNCVYDYNELGVENVEIIFQHQNDILSAITRSDGFYHLKMQPAEYQIILKDSFLLKDYNFVCGDDTLTVKSDQKSQKSFGYQPKVSSISGWVWQDNDSSATWDPGEKGMAGIELVLKTCNTTGEHFNLTTEADGMFQFQELQPGCYELFYNASTIPNAYVQSYPDSMFYTIDVTPGRSYINKNFGFFPKRAFLSGHVWLDENSDCIFSSNEAPFSDAKIELFTANAEEPIQSTVTNVDGSYAFRSLLPDTYRVELDSDDLSCFHKECIKYPDAIIMTAGDTIMDVDFALRQNHSKIFGIVWRDHNADNHFGGETGIANVQMKLFCSDSLVDSKMTDSQGRYFFSTPPGDYTVSVDTSSLTGFRWTDPLADSAQVIGKAITLPFCDSTEVNFGLQCLASVSGIVWLDDNKNQIIDVTEKTVEGVRIVLRTLNGDEIILSNATSSDGVYILKNIIPDLDYIIEPDIGDNEVSKLNFTTPESYQFKPEPCEPLEFNFGFSNFIKRYNAFTPNGDGINDVFRFGLPKNFGGDVYQLIVYDRDWRHLKTIDVFSQVDGWDGTDENGRAQPSDAYFYILRLNGEIKLKGMVTLLR